MATVRMSDELKNYIRSKAKEPFLRQREAWQKRVPNYAYEIYEAAVGSELVNTLRNVPNGWLLQSDIFMIQQINGVNISVKQTLPSDMPFPNDEHKHGDNLFRGRYGAEIYLKGDYQTMLDAFQAWKAEGEAINAKETAFVESINKIINAHSTLGPALKAWPPLWDLVSDSAKKAHERKVERGKADKPVIEDVNFDALTATMAAHKITRG